MENETIELITQTVEGNPIKDLKYNKRDNLLVGFVRDLVCGQANKDYYVISTWRLNGTLMPKYGGSTRKDLYLDLSKTY